MRSIGAIASNRKRTVSTPNTVLLLHFNGTDASTTFTDSSPYSKSATVFGNAQIDTAQSVFGGASGLFDGNGDYVRFPQSTDFNIGSGNFTVEFRVRFNVVPTSGGIASLVTTWNLVNGSDQSWQIHYTATGSVGNIVFRYIDAGGTTRTVSFSLPSILVTDTWYSMALSIGEAGVTNGIKCFLDGVKTGTDGTLNSLGVRNTVVDLDIGSLKSGTGGSLYLNGWIDELRITKGTARYTADYTPATSEFTS